MHKLKQLWIFAIALVFVGLLVSLRFYRQPDAGEWPKEVNYESKKRAHLDHKAFFADAEFKTPQEATAACLKCHENAAAEVMRTAHWTWLGSRAKKADGEWLAIGKKNLINNYCIGIEGNWETCTSCHAGYGWQDADFDFADGRNVDCLICHDWTGKYAKGKAGMPRQGVDLAAVAQGVGYPRRENCNICHSYGGGGLGVKHGDLDISLDNPSPVNDIHMGGSDMLCIDCHRTEKHAIPGKSISVSADHENGISCTDCHEERPHVEDRLNAHARVACQTCHIPTYANEYPTKLTWDWGKAGDMSRKDSHTYLQKKGEFSYGRRLIPEYLWFDLTADHYLMGDSMPAQGPTRINRPRGSVDDPKAQIWPFKIHRGRQPYDTTHDYLLMPVLSGKGGFWSEFDWPKALGKGAELHGMEFSGNYGFAETEMYWPLSHMVAPAEKALQCVDCHGEKSRLDWNALGYHCDPANPGAGRSMHPTFRVLDEEGRHVLESGKPVSTATTCGQCHNTGYIKEHSVHYNDRIKVDCSACHLDKEPVWDAAAFDSAGQLQREFVTLHTPANHNCATCHGMVHSGPEALTLPGDFGTVTGNPGEKSYFTERTGAIISPQYLSDSALNLAGKRNLTYPWDVHAARLIKCTDCHFAGNNPRKKARDRDLGHLIADPRVASASEYIYQPDHRLSTADCRDCHDAVALHRMPYSERHMEVLSCQTCHVPQLYGPALSTIDATAIASDGEFRREYRGIDPAATNPNVAYGKGYAPFLIAHETPNGAKISPFNLVTCFRWESGGRSVPREELRKIYDDPQILELFDADGDRQLSNREVVLDRPEKTEAIRSRLVAVGFADPRIAGSVEAYRVHHGVVDGDHLDMTCDNCHGPVSRLDSSIPLVQWAPGGSTPELRLPRNVFLSGEIVHAGPTLALEREAAADFYLFGFSRDRTIDLFGLLALILTVIGVSVHGALRYFAGKKIAPRPIETRQVYLYTAYVRLWHWLMVFCTVGLLLTGIEIHFTGALWILGFSRAVFVHNFLALVLVANGFLALFYHLSTGKIREFLPPRQGLLREIAAQIKFYTYGIFIGAPHPMARTPERHQNPLQQLAYLGLLNILLPAQIASGALIWSAGKWPALSRSLGGLTWLGPIHTAGFWLFCCFLIMHVYLTTTGPTVFSYPRAMAYGYDHIEVDRDKQR